MLRLAIVDDNPNDSAALRALVADYLIKNDLVAIAASDAHGLRYRTNNLIRVYDHLSIHYSPQYAKMLLLQNPYAICQNETL